MHKWSQIVSQQVLVGLMVVGVVVSVAGADLVPVGTAFTKKKCAGTQCVADTTTANDSCSGSIHTVACCCRPNASSAWGCSCKLPTDCTNEGSRRCDMATA